jgi:hypothetical protein
MTRNSNRYVWGRGFGPAAGLRPGASLLPNRDWKERHAKFTGSRFAREGVTR